MDRLFSHERRGTRPILGVVVAPVIDNVDFGRKGILKIRVPWGAQQELAAPVVAAGAGSNRGLFSLPKKGDNVLVAFEDGDATRPYVIGALWTGNDLAPIDQASAADTQHVLRTRAGQELRIDESSDKVTIKTQAGPSIECSPDQIKVIVGSGTSLVLRSDGSVELNASQSLTLKAPTISLQADASLKLTSNGETEVRGGPTCNINASTVRINS